MLQPSGDWPTAIGLLLLVSIGVFTTTVGAVPSAYDTPSLSYSALSKQHSSGSTGAEDGRPVDVAIPDAGVQLSTARKVSNMDKVLGFLNRMGTATSSSAGDPNGEVEMLGRKFGGPRPVSQIGKRFVSTDQRRITYHNILIF